MIRRWLRRRAMWRAVEQEYREIYPVDEWGSPVTTEKSPEQLELEAQMWDRHGEHEMASILRAATWITRSRGHW